MGGSLSPNDFHSGLMYSSRAGCSSGAMWTPSGPPLDPLWTPSAPQRPWPMSTTVPETRPTEYIDNTGCSAT
eukprot:1050582-Prorocentrum_minimum.AAC.7